MSPQPGEFRNGYSYYRRKKAGFRSGATELHDRRLNPIGRHGYGHDPRKKGSSFGELTRVSGFRKKNGIYVSPHPRRRR